EAKVGAMTVAGSYCAGLRAGLGFAGGGAELPVRPVPRASTVNMMAPAAAAKPINLLGSIVVPGIDGILLVRSVAGARSMSSGSGVWSTVIRSDCSAITL